MLHLNRSCLLLLGLLLPSTIGCSFSSRSAAESKSASSLVEPKILHDKVGAIPSLDARATKLVFFGSGPSDIAPLQNPTYRSRFEHATTKTIHPEIHLVYPPPGKKIYFTLTIHIREKGKTLRIVDYEGRIEPNWTTSYHSVGVGIMGPGNWRVGNYEVDVHINGEKMATGSFEIY